MGTSWHSANDVPITSRPSRRQQQEAWAPLPRAGRSAQVSSYFSPSPLLEMAHVPAGTAEKSGTCFAVNVTKIWSCVLQMGSFLHEEEQPR